MKRRIMFIDPESRKRSYKEHAKYQLSQDFDLCFTKVHSKLLVDLLNFAPDFIFLNMNSSFAMQVLQDLCVTGNTACVVVGGNSEDSYYQAQLTGLNVGGFLRAPFRIEDIVKYMRGVVSYAFRMPEENYVHELDYILLRLGFNMASSNYKTLKLAIMLKFEDISASMTKEIYPALMLRYNCSYASAEKGLRDLIRLARVRCSQKDYDLWLPFFPALAPDKNPTTEEFLARIANALHKMEKPRLSMDELAKLMNDLLY